MGKAKKPFLRLSGSCLGALATLVLMFACAMPPRINRVKEFSGAIASIPPAWKEEPIIVLSDSVTLKFVAGNGTGGNQVRHRQTTWYYVNRRNPNVLEQIVVADFQSIERVPDIQATAYYPDGGSWSVGSMGIPRERYTEEGLYSSERYISGVHFPSYVEGMLIRLEVDRTYDRPEFLTSELLRDNYPSLERIISLSLPKGSGIKHGLVNPESLKVTTSLAETGTEQTLTVKAMNLQKLEMASIPRDPETWLAALHMSIPAKGLTSLSWTELGDTYLATVGESFRSTPELEKLAAGLKQQNPDSLIRNVYSLLRSRIRYHADLEKLHAYVPRPAGEVLAKGYGDCKEMSTLMTELLRMKGVHAGVALVSTPGILQVVDAYPSLGGFNHMIVYVEGANGEIRFFDPTVKHGDPADSYYDLIDRTALVLKEKGSALKTVPMGPGYRNHVETRSTIRKGTGVQSAGAQNWALIGSIRLEGQCAFSLLPLLNAFQGEEKKPLLKSYLKEMFSVDATDCRVASAGDRIIEVTYEASFNSNYLAMDKGGLLMTSPSLFGGDVRFSAVSVEGPRYVGKFDQSDSWDIPAGFDDLEKNDLDHPLGHGKWVRKGGNIQRTFASDVNVVPAEKRDYMSDYVRKKNRFVRATLWRR
jgi:hypothetical protein